MQKIWLSNFYDFSQNKIQKNSPVASYDANNECQGLGPCTHCDKKKKEKSL